MKRRPPEDVGRDETDNTAYCPHCLAEEIETGYGRFEHSPNCRAKVLQWDDNRSQWVIEGTI